VAGVFGEKTYSKVTNNKTILTTKEGAMTFFSDAEHIAKRLEKERRQRMKVKADP
jgi:hypothetical protein